MYLKTMDDNIMKKILLFLCIVIGLFMTTTSTGLRAAANGPEGLPDDDDDSIDIYDDDDELNEEDAIDLDAEDEDSLPPIGDTTLPPQEAEVEDDDDDENELSIEEIGELMEDPGYLDSIINTLVSAFVTKNEPIVSKPGEQVDCYSIENPRCEFVAEELPVVFVVTYNDDDGDYVLDVKRSAPETEVMRRRLRASSCDGFTSAFKLFNREINCELKEYTHKISLKHIG